MKSFIVTGGLGFIGSNLAKELSKKNKVIIIDDLSSGKLSNIKKNKNIKIIIQKVQNIKQIKKKVDGIFHFAAQPSVPLSIKNTYNSTSNNLLSSLKIFEIAKFQKIPILYASSSAIYGNIAKGNDKKNKFDILSPYALDKLYLENLATLYFDLFHVSSVGMRFFNVYGPNQDENNPYSGVIPKFINLTNKNKTLTVYGGYQTRDFIFINDVVKICLMTMNKMIKSKRKFYNFYNVGTGKEISINKLTFKLSDLIKKNIKIKKTQLPLGDPVKSLGDIKKIVKFLKLKKDFFTPFEKGLFKTILSYE